MVPIENQERPNIKSVYTCSNCEKALFDGDDDHPRWNFCPMCGQEIEWDKSAKVVWEEKNCNVCGGWLVKRHPGNVKKCAVGKYPKSEKPGGAGQAAVCACAHSRYFAGGSPSGLRV